MKASTKFIRKSTAHIQRNCLGRSLFIISFVLILTRLTMIGNQDLFIKITWLCLMSLIIFTCSNIEVLWAFLCIAIMFPSSGWYLGANFGFHFRDYFLLENELFYFKPNEIFLILFSIKIFFKSTSSLDSYRYRMPNISLNRVFFLFFITITMGIFIGKSNGYSFHSIFIFSEFRVLVEGFIFFYITYYCLEDYNDIYTTLHLLVCLSVLKSVIALLEFKKLIPNIFSYSGLSISSYSSVISGIQDLNIIILAIIILTSYLIFSKETNKTYFQKIGIVICISFLIGTVIFSYRRTSYFMLIIGLAILYAHFNFRKFVISIYSMSLLILAVTWIYNTSNISRWEKLNFIKSRILLFNKSNQPKEVLISNKSHINDFLIATEIVKKNPFWGIGVGSRFIADRSFVYETNLIHNGILHTWIKFGFFGVILYLLTYFCVLIEYIKNKRYFTKDKWILYMCVTYILVNLASEIAMPPFYQNFQKTTFLFLVFCIMYKMNSLRKTEIS